jgi:hypothetical protein
MVGRRYFTRYLSARLNYLRYGGRVPPERESLEQELDIRVLPPRRDRGTGAVDVPEGHRLKGY